MGVVPLDSHRVSRDRRYLGGFLNSEQIFHLQDCHLLWLNLPGHSIRLFFCNCSPLPEERTRCSRDPTDTTTPVLTCLWFRLFPFRSPLLRKSRFLSLPVGTEMFHFPTFALTVLFYSDSSSAGLPQRVSPFGNPRVRVFAANRGLSQLTTSFIASQCQGIHHTLLVTCTIDIIFALLS